ncbi:MAG TPA: YciI family protein [Casimicrobiaceae bacterium]
MRFMILRKSDRNTEALVMPSSELLGAMGQYMESMAKAGVLRGGEGLRPTSEGARVKFSGGQPTVVDGPFAETKELIGGYCLLECKSQAEAIEWAKRWPPMDGDVELEIRRLFEAEDFGAEFTPEQREAEAKMRAKLG